MTTVTHDIVAKLWNLCNVLKDDGVTYHQYVTELTYLLFLKMAKETGTEDQIPDGYRWDDLEAKAAAGPAGVLQAHRSSTWAATAPCWCGRSSPTPVPSSRSPPPSPPWSARSTSSTGTAPARRAWATSTKGCLQKNANEKKSGAGQYFTPRPLIDSMVAVMQPTLEDIIQDPAAGTGGFLIAANRYLARARRPGRLDRGAAAQVPPQHLLRHGARAGHPPPGAHEPDAARDRLRPPGRPASATATPSPPRARPCPRPR